MTTTIAPAAIATVPARGCEESVATIHYAGRRPHRTVAALMRLVYFPETGTAHFTSADHPVTGETVTVHHGDVVQVGAHTFAVEVAAGFRPVFPDLRAV